MYSIRRVNPKKTMKNKSGRKTVSDTKGKARDQLENLGPLRSVFLIFKIGLTGNLGMIMGKIPDLRLSPFSYSLTLPTACRMAREDSGFTQSKEIMLENIFCPLNMSESLSSSFSTPFLFYLRPFYSFFSPLTRKQRPLSTEDRGIPWPFYPFSIEPEPYL